MSSNKAIIPLHCQAMNYAWGKVGKKSLVYQYIAHNQKEGNDPNAPYAEFWMGDHPNAPSVNEDGKRISEILKNSDKTDEESLPFLFKILSVQKPLSLQCHPNLKNAAILHKKDPQHYPDPNHKPEMGFFLTKGSLLYGIREYKQIIKYFEKVPEFKNLISKDALENFVSNPNKETFKVVFNQILTCDKKRLSENLTVFKAKHAKGEYSFIDEHTNHGIDLIIENFPNDVGVFIPFILNVVVFQPGEAIVMQTGTLHAYLEGDLIEIMAISDNVVRAAMTPKFVDVETLFKVMTFDPQGPKYINPTKEYFSNNQKSFLDYFATGYDSFNLEHGNMQSGETMKIKAKKCASIISILKGKIKLNGKEFHEGNTALVIANNELQVENAGEESVDFYIGFSQ
ncbi:hypothetical protein M9Y10_017019 [Tritrichomonas musculus]|uniref:mannose-6-phosphate isomerase n=1 Tax=Tritrichomonas musculus TaxID=1915356 RepID=A0ABR2HXU1_9EUKA